jgi:hypothetical protein
VGEIDALDLFEEAVDEMLTGLFALGVTISTPASSCSFTASMVASRLARASSSPFDFQGAQSVLGSASHSGLGREPAIVVGNSMGASRSVLIERLSAMSYDRGTEQRKSPKSAKRVFKQNPAWGARKGRGKGRP